MQFNDMLKDAMANAGVTAAHIGRITGRATSTVQRWLNGTQTPNDIVIHQLGRYLKDDAGYFLQKGTVYANGTSRR